MYLSRSLVKTRVDTQPKIRCQPVKTEELELENKVGEKVGSLSSLCSAPGAFVYNLSCNFRASLRYVFVFCLQRRKLSLIEAK